MSRNYFVCIATDLNVVCVAVKGRNVLAWAAPTEQFWKGQRVIHCHRMLGEPFGDWYTAVFSVIKLQ